MKTRFPIVGIDFGTSNSKMAWYNPRTHQAETIRNSEKKEQTPSVVYFGEKDILVGGSAIDMLVDEQERENVIISVKRELVSTPILAIPGKSVKTVDVAATILHKLKEDAEITHFQQEVIYAVITYPASFTGMEQDKLREAARLAGFHEIELLEEPVAAALAYAQMGLKVGDYVLVYDLGGGTFDLALLAREDDGSFRLAMEPQGMKRCGGDDFDEALYNYCDKIAREKLGRSISLTGKRDLNFLNECRHWKENLSSRERRSIRCLLEPDAVLFQHEIDRAIFESLIKTTIEETIRKTKAILEEARADGYAVDTLVLIGGSTSIPLVQRLLGERLPLKPLAWQYQDIAVALGAAYHAYSLWGPETQYRKAVRAAWADQWLDESKIAGLTTLAKTLGLDENQIADLECEVMDNTKDVIFARQGAQDQYRATVQAVWANKKLDETNIQELTTLAKTLALNSDQVVDLEREVMGEVKETILARQRAQEQYRRAVEKAWAAKTLDEKAVEHLTALVQGLDLSRETVVTIERKVMGEVKEVVFAQQVARVQYRETVKVIWADKTLDATKVEQLINLAHTLNLSEDQVAGIECEEMGEAKEIIFARQRALAQYREAVNEVWANKKLDRRKIAQLYAVSNRLNLSDDQIDNIERELMNDIKERIFVTQYNNKNKMAPASTNLINTLTGHPTAIRCVTFSPDGQILASNSTAAASSITKQWNSSSGELFSTYTWRDCNVPYITFHPNGMALAVGSNMPSLMGRTGRMLKVWNARTGYRLYDFQTDFDHLNCFTLSKDGQTLAFSCDDRTVKLWSLRNGNSICVLKGHSSFVNVIAFSPNGRNLASGSDDNTVKFWKLPTGDLFYTLTDHKGHIHALAFSSDKQTLASGSSDNTIKLWDLDTGKLFRTLSGHSGSIHCLAFSSNEQLLASGSMDKTIRLWNPYTGDLLQTLTGHTSSVNSVAFSPDGQILASGSDDNTIKVWKITSMIPKKTEPPSGMNQQQIWSD